MADCVSDQSGALGSLPPRAYPGVCYNNVDQQASYMDYSSSHHPSSDTDDQTDQIAHGSYQQQC